MAEELYYLSRGDRDLLIALKEDLATRRKEALRHPTRDLPQAPEVYVARAPAGGIPALSVIGTGTGDEPGHALCDVYRIAQSFGAGTGTADDGPPKMVRVNPLQRYVYNFTTADIAAHSWLVLVRDKFGLWIVSNNGGGDDSANVWRMVKPTSQTTVVSGLYPAYVQGWNSTSHAYYDETRCLIKLASGETVVKNERYEGEPLSTYNVGTGTGTATTELRIYGVDGNELECAPGECDDSGNIVSYDLLYHRAPFKIVRGWRTSACMGTGTGTG